MLSVTSNAWARTGDNESVRLIGLNRESIRCRATVCFLREWVGVNFDVAGLIEAHRR